MDLFNYRTVVIPEPTTPPTPNQEHKIMIFVTPVDGDNTIARLEGQMLPRSILHTNTALGATKVSTLSRPIQNFAFALFGSNNQNKLRKDYTDHPIRKGSGVWGKELEDGDFVFVDFIWVAEGWRNRRIGERLVQLLIEAGKQLLEQFAWVFMHPSCFEVPRTWTAVATDAAVDGPRNKEEREAERLGRHNGCVLNAEYERQEVVARGSEKARSFWCKMGARRIGMTFWFCIAIDPNHPSRRLAIQDEPLRPVDFLPHHRCENISGIHNKSVCEAG